MPFRIADGFQCTCNFESSFICEFCITRSSDTGIIWGLADGSVAHAAACAESGGSKLEVGLQGLVCCFHVIYMATVIRSSTPRDFSMKIHRLLLECGSLRMCATPLIQIAAPFFSLTVRSLLGMLTYRDSSTSEGTAALAFLIRPTNSSMLLLTGRWRIQSAM